MNRVKDMNRRQSLINITPKLPSFWGTGFREILVAFHVSHSESQQNQSIRLDENRLAIIRSKKNRITPLEPERPSEFSKFEEWLTFA